MARKTELSRAYRQGRADAAALMSVVGQCIDRAAQGDRWSPVRGWEHDTNIVSRAVRLIEQSA